MKKPKLILSNRTPPILREIQDSIDADVPKKEGNISIANIKKIYTVKKGKEIVHQGANFRIAYSFFLKLVINNR